MKRHFIFKIIPLLFVFLILGSESDSYGQTSNRKTIRSNVEAPADALRPENMRTTLVVKPQTARVASPPTREIAKPKTAKETKAKEVAKPANETPTREGYVWVNGYTRKNGTHVKGHWRKK